MKKTFIIIGTALLVIGLFFRFFCGIFVVQPIGAIPEGVTIVYWRNGTNMPFIASADGLLQKTENGVSLLGRGMMLASLVPIIKEREIMRFGYSEQFYLWSTDGKEYEK